jgi:predicted phage terminase large subunit-like protein
MPKNKSIRLGPQPGPQEAFLYSTADIVIYGGAAGGGKSYAVLLEALRNVDVKGFGAVIFRRSMTSIEAEGSILDTSKTIYPLLGGKLRSTPRPSWTFSSGAKITMAHLQYEDTVMDWHGTQIALLVFDELCEFEYSQFFYMLSRNRSTCGVRPYVRATCNPDADSWVASFISWWIDPKTGYAIPERSGVVRYFLRVNDEIVWGDSPEELVRAYPEFSVEDAKSCTFIASTIHDNQELLRRNPQYLSNLKALCEVEKERLLYGNWKIKPAGGLYFRREQIVEFLEVVPADVVRWVRGWDLAATAEREGSEPAYTAGVLMGKRKNGRYIIADVINKRLAADDVRKLIRQTAQLDRALYKRVKIRLPQDPGQAGKEQAASYIKLLSGFDVTAQLESGSKETRAEPFAAQWQAGNVDLLISKEWNESLINQYVNFPESKFKDMVDAGSAAFNELEGGNNFNIKILGT